MECIELQRKSRQWRILSYKKKKDTHGLTNKCLGYCLKSKYFLNNLKSQYYLEHYLLWFEMFEEKSRNDNTETGMLFYTSVFFSSEANNEV